MKSPEDIKVDFPILENLTYLDSASTSLTPNQVLEAMNSYYQNYNANTGRGVYKIAIKATEEVEKTRSKIANLINTKTKEIIFTKNTTEAINTIANGLQLRNNEN
ncbi:MAG: aminotransferase class V-fold PLP-dependent enzyme, partial [Methanobrevibacter sp.]|nr:aminotransferase class V-fold PLP-dependent enzyme [Methanobrevibacter sp.]